MEEERKNGVADRGREGGRGEEWRNRRRRRGGEVEEELMSGLKMIHVTPVFKLSPVMKALCSDFLLSFCLYLFTYFFIFMSSILYHSLSPSYLSSQRYLPLSFTLIEKRRGKRVAKYLRKKGRKNDIGKEEYKEIFQEWKRIKIMR